ncbi:MAG: hypothetical protein Q4G62_09300 [Pseudomonadota bacterium]|nr:hypothetical protein [Pseudomonadota bacterium]
MADEFKRMTGIDPLTIEQTRLWDQPDASRHHPAYAEGLKLWRAQHQNHDPTAAFLVMTGPQSAWSLQPSSYDISIFAAPWTNDQHWRALDGLRQRRTIASNPCTRYPCLIEARYMAESDEAIPADRQLLEQAGPVQLWLRDGCYRVRHLPNDTEANGAAQPVCFPVEAGAGPVTPSR